MQSEGKKQQVLDVLNYWFILDFMSQNALKSPFKEPDDKTKTNGSDESEENSFGKGKRGRENAAKGGKEKKASISIQDLFRPATEIENNSNQRLIDSVERRLAGLDKAKDVPKYIYLHLGSIPRESIVSFLWRSKDDEPCDKEIDYIASAILDISDTGTFVNFELSPVLWAVYVYASRGDVVSSINEYEKRNEEITKELAEYFGNSPLTFNDIREITDKYVAQYLQPVAVNGYLNGSSTTECLRPILFDYWVSNKENFSYKVSFRSFFAKDISALRSCIEESSSLDKLNNTQLSLVARYLMAGLEGDDRKRKRVDVLGAEMDPGAAEAFYRWSLDYDNIPLGRWPSKYALSLMQQTAVDLVCGRVRERGQFAANDVMSVNGPPGTGKTTLLKDIIAANIVEKARLLSECEKPDDAFEKVKLRKSYIKRGKGEKASPVNLYRLKKDKDRINDLGIIVCSSNNAAVENISKELPSASSLLDGLSNEEGREFIDDELSKMEWYFKGENESSGEYYQKKDLYFSFSAFNQFKEINDKVDVPHYDVSDQNLDMLLAARLGKKKNRNDFLFNSLCSLPWSCKKTSEGSDYWKAKESFRAQYDLVNGEMAKVANARAAVRDAHDQGLNARENVREAEKELDTEKSVSSFKIEKAFSLIERNGAQYGLRPERDSLEALRCCAKELRDIYANYESEKHSLTSAVEIAELEVKDCSEKMAKFIHLIRGKDDELPRAKKKLAAAQSELKAFNIRHQHEAELGDVLPEIDALLTSCEQTWRDLNNADHELQRLQRVEENQIVTAGSLAEKANELVSRAVGAPCEGDGKMLPFAYEEGLVSCLASGDGEDLREAHLFNPVAGKELMHDRDLLFLRALQFTREFILSSSCMRDNFAYLKAYWGLEAFAAGSDKKERIKFEDDDKKKIAPVVFQALNVLTPVISTTFASAQAMFEDIAIKPGNKAPLGLLVIDEAGQAVPYAALGVLSRCRRTMVVGDPYQIEPVVPQEAKALRSAIAGDINLFYKGDIASVQKFADELNPYGQKRYETMEGDYEDSAWVGCPLIVHRRCVSPMFDISNEVSYQGSMINETPSLDPSKPGDKKKLDSFYLPSSQWLNVVGPERGNKDHYVDEQGKRVVEIVTAAFDKRIDKSKAPSLYVIAPFKTVVRGLKQALQGKDARPRGVGEKLWEEFIDNNIGTVHTFQGKEALEVIFVLGCDERAGGAVQFVNPNIVNVAASRAKQRLYVVGDYRVWQDNPSICTMKKILDTAWVKHWEAYRETGDKNELRLAREMAPMAESMPFRVEKTEDGEEKVFEVDSYVENMSEYTDRMVRENDCSQYGFVSLDEIEGMLANCADGEKNKVLGFVKQGIFEYLSKVCGPREIDEDYDLSLILIMFGKVAEAYLDKRLLPTLKAAIPDYKFSKSMLLAKQEKLSVAKYVEVVGEKQGPDILAWRTGLVEANSVGADRRWWKSVSKSIDKFRVERNKSAHPEIVHLDELEAALRRLGVKRAAESRGDADFVTILGHEDVYEAAMRGVEIQDAVAPEFRVVDTDEGPLPSALAQPDPATRSVSEMPEEATFSLSEFRLTTDDGCLAFGKLQNDERFSELKKTVLAGGGQYSKVVLGYLEKAGYITNRRFEFEGAAGRYPTESGAKLGFRWRLFNNEDGSKSSGVVFDAAAQDWLAENLLDLHRRYGRQP